MADTPTTGPQDDDIFTFDSAANKEYPLAPPGVHEVTIVSAKFSMRDNPFKPESGKQPTASLRLQSNQVDEEKKHYNLFKTMKISDHEKASMFAFFRDVLGMAIPLNAEKKIVMRRKVVETDDGEEVVTLPQFENLKFSAVIKHEKKEDGKMRDKIDSVFASPEQQKANAALFLAPEA